MVFKKDLSLEKDWVDLLYKIKEISGKRPADINAVLFLIGVQELGKGNKTFSKEEKQDLDYTLPSAKYFLLQGIMSLKAY